MIARFTVVGAAEMVEDVSGEWVRFRVVAGWRGFAEGDPQPRVFEHLEDACAAYPEVFDQRMTLDEMRARVDYVESEGNFHEFVFRPAWPGEE